MKNAYKNQVLNLITGGDTELSELNSEIYQDMILQLLNHGVQQIIEDMEGREKMMSSGSEEKLFNLENQVDQGSGSKSIYFRFTIPSLYNGGIGITFTLGVENIKGFTPSMYNHIDSSTTIERQGGQYGTIIDDKFIRNNSSLFNLILNRRGINQRAEEIFRDFPRLIVKLADYTTQFLNSSRMSSDYKRMLITSGAIEFGGIKLQPVVHNNHVFYKFELSEELRNTIKIDSVFINQKEDESYSR